MEINDKIDQVSKFQDLIDLFGVTDQETFEKSKTYIGFFGWKCVKVEGYRGDVNVTHLLNRVMIMARRKKFDYTPEERLALRKFEVVLSKIDDDLEDKKWKTNFITRFFIWLFNPDYRTDICNFRAFDWEETREKGLYVADYYQLEEYKEKYGKDPEDLECGVPGFSGCYKVYALETPQLIKV